jgi:hypothetical protein
MAHAKPRTIRAPMTVLQESKSAAMIRCSQRCCIEISMQSAQGRPTSYHTRYVEFIRASRKQMNSAPQ